MDTLEKAIKKYLTSILTTPLSVSLTSFSQHLWCYCVYINCGICRVGGFGLFILWLHFQQLYLSRQWLYSNLRGICLLCISLCQSHYAEEKSLILSNCECTIAKAIQDFFTCFKLLPAVL